MYLLHAIEMELDSGDHYRTRSHEEPRGGSEHGDRDRDRDRDCVLLTISEITNKWCLCAMACMVCVSTTIFESLITNSQLSLILASLILDSQFDQSTNHPFVQLP